MSHILLYNFIGRKRLKKKSKKGGNRLLVNHVVGEPLHVEEHIFVPDGLLEKQVVSGEPQEEKIFVPDALLEELVALRLSYVRFLR